MRCTLCPRRYCAFGIGIGQRVQQVMARRIGVTLNNCDCDLRHDFLSVSIKQ
jgi:hypothetical protein